MVFPGFTRSALSSRPQSHLEPKLTVVSISVLLVQFRFCLVNFGSDLLISVLTL